jgi:hypothetical protein
MRRPRLALACAAAAVVGLVAPALAASTGSAQTGAAGLVVPSSAGRLTQGPREILWPATRGASRPAHQANAGNQQLLFGGGLRGRGGVQHHPAVYLVFWGSQWKQADPYANYEQRFFHGLYGAGDNWTGVQREWCDGLVKKALSCPQSAARVGTPHGPLVKGVWFDDSALALPTDNPVVRGLPDAVAQEAVRAAAHFGNKTVARNRDAQYIINEPKGFDSLGFGLYCGYHSYVGSGYGPLAYTDLPYVTDLGFDCGQNYVNSGADGTYDGLSLVAGHEFIETLTDPYPNNGWVDAGGEENADKCAWKSSGAGAMTDLHLSTGTFAVQGSWSNLANNGNGGCRNHVGR